MNDDLPRCINAQCVAPFEKPQTYTVFGQFCPACRKYIFDKADELIGPTEANEKTILALEQLARIR